MKTIVNYPLTDAIQWMVLFGAFTERWYELSIVVLVSVIIFWRTMDLHFSKNLLLLFSIISIFSIFSITYIGYTYDKFTQQVITLFLIVVCYYNFFRFIDRNIDSLFKKYLKIIYIIAMMGLLQFFIYALTGYNIFSFLYDVRTFLVAPRVMRATSILKEPSEFSVLLIPSLTYFLFKQRKENKDTKYKIILLSAILVSFSTTAYVILVLIFIYKYFFYIKNILLRSFAIIFVIIIILYIYLNETKVEGVMDSGPLRNTERHITQTLEAFSNMNPASFEALNLSTYATMTNLWVSINSPMRLIGTGLGTHVQNYKSQYESEFRYYGLNSEDAYSLAVRIYSEMGLVGFILSIIFLIINFNKRNPINIGFAFLLLSQMIRGGHYFRYGLVMYIFMYYFTGKSYNK